VKGSVGETKARVGAAVSKVLAELPR